MLCRNIKDFSKGLTPASFPTLKCLHLNYLSQLAAVAPLASLREVSLGGCQLQDSLLYSLARLSSLTKLDLSHYSPGSRVSDASLAKLAALTALEELDISGAAKVSDWAIPSLLYLQQLSCLDLSGSSVTHTGVERLSGLPSLRKLRCCDCPDLTIGRVQTPQIRLCLYKCHRRELYEICNIL